MADASLAPVALLAMLPVLASLWKQGPCLQQGWGGTEPFWRFCYSDLAVGVQTADAERGITAYLSGDVPLDQPPLTGSVVSLIAGLGPGTGALATQRWVLGVWAVLALVALVLMAWWVRTTPDHRGDALQVALAPVAALTILLSPDLLGVVLATGGLWAWSRRHPALAGALLGAGLMARTYPALLLLVVAVQAWRTGRERELPRFGGAALAAAAVIALPFLILSPGTITRSWSAWFDAPAGLGSVWYLPTLAGSPWPASVLTAVAVLGVLVAVVLAALLVLGAPWAPRLGAVALLAVAVVLISGKSFPVQTSLWLVPLVALAGLRWRDHLVWALAEAVHFMAVWLYLSGLQNPDKSLPPGWYAVALLLRVGAVGFLAVRAWQTATGPGDDTDDLETSERQAFDALI
ncbi:putative transmembrane protein [Janibacter sp. HTCC2649]|uniref:putative transmembrane protein n=1 Tax=Janibacter sp. HTCC2649 TaxID=313589 RepID=UPI000067190F|nr:putative transmembrane protein [Janibacter sp. HTCC2649]EAP98002.1 putative transmembrane protein [Janibacter sp. HTCC2649]